SFRNTNTLNYDFKKIIGDKHHLNVLIGQEMLKTDSKDLTNTLHGFPSEFKLGDALKLTPLAKEAFVNNFYNTDDNMVSFFSRVNYDYKSNYIFSATMRADGSSKFSKSNRWGYFPSAAVAWRVSSEPFMQATKSWLDDLKIRFSYGTAGNNNIPSGQVRQVFASNSTTWINGTNYYLAASKDLANPKLKWETTITRNIGLDYTLLEGRLNGSLEFYLNSTKDLLIKFPVAGSGY
ncbi:MAG: TonB-dependent receptor, partial [Bacteroidaceae bacterium]